MGPQAADRDGADLSRLLARDPAVRAGLRTLAVHRWRLNEGSVSIRISLGTGSYEWR
jgi:hypothetical protein